MELLFFLAGSRAFPPGFHSKYKKERLSAFIEAVP